MSKIDLLQGTLDMLILRVLARGEMHGWGIVDRLSQLSKNTLKLGEGSVYPSLYRMETKGWIKAEWAQSDNNRVVDALKAHLDGIADEGARVAFLHSIGISDERDTKALLARDAQDDAKDGGPADSGA